MKPLSLFLFSFFLCALSLAQAEDLINKSGISLRTRLVASQNNNGGKDIDTRRLEIDLFNTKKRELEVTIIWIGDKGTKDDYGVYKRENKTITADGKSYFSMSFIGNIIEVKPKVTKKKTKGKKGKKGKKTPKKPSQYISDTYSRNYRGYAVKITDENGNLLANAASTQAFIEYVD